MKGEISIEFLTAFAAYLVLLLLLIASFSHFYAQLEDSQEKVFAKAKGEFVSLLYSVRDTNNPCQRVRTELARGCAIYEEEVSCGDVVVRRYTPRAYCAEGREIA